MFDNPIGNYGVFSNIDFQWLNTKTLNVATKFQVKSYVYNQGINTCFVFILYPLGLARRSCIVPEETNLEGSNCKY